MDCMLAVVGIACRPGSFPILDLAGSLQYSNHVTRALNRKNTVRPSVILQHQQCGELYNLRVRAVKETLPV